MDDLFHDIIYSSKKNVVMMYENPLRDIMSQFSNKDRENTVETTVETTEIKNDLESLDVSFDCSLNVVDSDESIYLDDICSVSTLDTIESTHSNQTDESLAKLLKDATEEFYSLAQTKWKVFTFTITTAISVSYITGLIMLGKLDTHDVSIKDRHLYMGVIGLYPGCRDNRDQLWRLFSSIFSHANLSHFGGNIIGLFGFSYLLEMYQSVYVIAPLFLMGTIHGNLSFYYTKPYSFAIGASQGVFVIVGMNIANILMNIYAFNLFHSYVITYFCMTVVFSEMLSYNETNNIAYICHWASGLSGLIGGMAWFTQYEPSMVGKYVSTIMKYTYLLYTAMWFYSYAFLYPPLQSYSNLFEPIETVNCCYEKFHFEHEYPDNGNFTCPYKLTYEDNMPRSMYKS